MAAADASRASRCRGQGRVAERRVQLECRMVGGEAAHVTRIIGVDAMRSGDVALRLLAVFSVAGFIALAASLYEVDRREKSNSGTAGVNLIEIEQQVQVLSNQIRILSNQLVANERQAQLLDSQIQALDWGLRGRGDALRARR